MGRRLIPCVVVSTILALTIAATAIAFVPENFRLWRAAIALVVLGGITPLIFAVNARIVPVFSGRDWQQPTVLYAAMVMAIAGAWGVFAGRALPHEQLEQASTWAALVGGVLFVVSVIRLFRSPKTGAPTPPLPFPEQAAIDKIGTHFMRLAALYLLAGLGVGVLLLYWTPSRGRWDLVWAHLMLVGWFLSMASGVLYHVLSRWTWERWRHPKLITTHLVITLVGLPFMVIALALNHHDLFFVAGPLQAAALLIMVWNVFPLARKLPELTRTAVIAAACFLALGVTLGASVATDPGNHVNLRWTHAQINLFGWGGLLICGVGYYLFPRFAGQPLRWPRVARAQMLVLLAGVVVSATAWWWYFAVDTAVRPLITISAMTIAGSFLTFAVIVGLTFRRPAADPRNVTVQTVQIAPRR